MASVGVLADGKPDEWKTAPLLRGRFSELIVALAGMPGHASALFLLGLVSVMDAILGPAAQFDIGAAPGAYEYQGGAAGAQGFVMAVA